MKAPTKQQILLGWEGVDLDSHYFVCMCELEGRVPFPLTAHRALTHALYRNGNRARHWKAEKKKAKQRRDTAIWDLKDVEGETVTLFLEYRHESEIPPVPIASTSVHHEKGAQGRSREILKAVRQSL